MAHGPLSGQDLLYETESLKIHQLSEHTYLHTTYLQTESFGLVSCNGMIVISQGQSAVFDTPSVDSVSLELIGWLQDSLHTKIHAVVINHHHADCLGGLNAFQKESIPSISSRITQELAEENNYPVPSFGFLNDTTIAIGKLQIQNRFVGGAHAQGTIFSYVVEDRVLFGGCSVRSQNAGKGYLGDANVFNWPIAMKTIQIAHPAAEIVIPGHGTIGGSELLNYTAELFNE